MDKNSERVLHAILSDISDEQTVTAMDTISDLCLRKMSPKIFDLSLRFLADNGYIVYERFTDGSPCIRPMHKAYIYFESKRKEKFTSFFTPISVSVITNLIITALKWLYPLLKQWLSHILERISS